MDQYVGPFTWFEQEQLNGTHGEAASRIHYNTTMRMTAENWPKQHQNDTSWGFNMEPKNGLFPYGFPFKKTFLGFHVEFPEGGLIQDSRAAKRRPPGW